MAAESTWIDYTIIIIVVAVGLAILYKALKEPLDMLGRGVKNIFSSVRDKVSDARDERMVIEYG